MRGPFDLVERGALIGALAVLIAFFFIIAPWQIFFKSHSEAVDIEIINGDQDEECPYVLTIGGEASKKGVLEPGEAILFETTLHWKGWNEPTIEISNGPLTLKGHWDESDNIFRFILYPDHIEEVGT